MCHFFVAGVSIIENFYEPDSMVNK